MKIKVMTINPETARSLLKINTNNRTVRQAHVDYLAAEMKNGQWRLTHQGIAINGKNIVDGQHRLLAIIQSGCSVDMLVASDSDSSIQDVVDVGRMRSAGDQLQLVDGVSGANFRAAISRQIVGICVYGQNPKIGVVFIRRILKEFSKEIDVIVSLIDEHKYTNARKSWVVAALAFGLSADPELAPFVKSFISGDDLRGSDPAKTAREWLNRGSAHNLTKNYKRYAVEGLLNAASNAIQGNKITTIKKGVNGLDYFLNKKKRFVTEVREQVAMQVD